MLRVQTVESQTHNLGHLAVSQLCRKQDKTSELEALMVIMHQERAIITGSLIRNRWRSGCGYGWSNTARTISGILAVGQLWRKTISHKCTHTKFPIRHAGIWIGSSTARLRKESLGMPRPGAEPLCSSYLKKRTSLGCYIPSEPAFPRRRYLCYRQELRIGGIDGAPASRKTHHHWITDP